MTQPAPAFQSFVGVDLHKCTVSLAAVDPGGQPIARLKTSTKCIDKLDAWLEALPSEVPGSGEVPGVYLAVEACPFVEWFIDHYRPRVTAA